MEKELRESYRLVSGLSEPVGGGPVPGVGPILDVVVKDGCVFATRSDGEKPVTYREANRKWEAI